MKNNGLCFVCVFLIEMLVVVFALNKIEACDVYITPISEQSFYNAYLIGKVDCSGQYMEEVLLNNPNVNSFIEREKIKNQFNLIFGVCKIKVYGKRYLVFVFSYTDIPLKESPLKGKGYSRHFYILMDKGCKYYSVKRYIKNNVYFNALKCV